MITLKQLTTTDPQFWAKLHQVLAWDSVSDHAIQQTVSEIIQTVKLQGDAAVLEYTRRFDRREVASMAQLQVSPARLEQAVQAISESQRSALAFAIARVQAYANRQKLESWQYTEADGSVLGQQVTPLDKVGLYVPGGKAAYPSTVIMNAIPAKVAGVAELIMVVPAPEGHLNDLVLAAAQMAGVDRVLTVGGAQAVAALAYGTDTIPAVDKIVGPGNIYVATAKRMLYGTVGIDMVAGPSEILIISDGNTNPDWLALDLFSQAEHDEDAQAILVSPSAQCLAEVMASIQRLLPLQTRAAIIQASLQRRGAMILVKDLDEAITVANTIAPEHLELSLDEPQLWAAKIRHAGAIFMGRHSAEALGDYCAGPNHVLPTARTARFSSPLGVYDFQKRSSLIWPSAAGASELAKVAAILARGEGLEAHAGSAEARIKPYQGTDNG